jgi:hypothetical protein
MLILAVILAIALIAVALGVSYQLLQEKSESAAVMPNPIASPNTDHNSKASQSLKATSKLSQDGSPIDNFINITQGNSVEINVNLVKLTNDCELTIPLYLSIGAFEDQPCTRIIAVPPSPYPSLPWPSHENSLETPNPFNCTFDTNPIFLTDQESKTSTLSITALDDARVGRYKMFLEMGDWEETGLGSIIFQLVVLAKQ